MSRLEVDLFDRTPDPDLLCAICHCVLFNPTEASTCRHVFCRSCIMTWLNSGAQGARTCPTCRSAMTSYNLRRALPALCNVIGRLVMRCVNHGAGCSTQLKVEQLETHLRIDCQCVRERCECGTEFLRRDREAHKDVCVYCTYPCSKCDLMITAREQKTHNCFLALQQAISGQKYLLNELRRQLALDQPLHDQLVSFDRRTRNYNSSLTSEFLPSTHNFTAASTHVASSRLSPDALVEYWPSTSTTSNSGNQRLTAAKTRESEENTLPARFVSPVSPRHQSAGGTPRHDALTPSYYSEDESEGSVSHSAGEDQTPRHSSDVDEDEELDVDEYSDGESAVDEDYCSPSYDEYDDSDEYSGPSVVPRETYSDSDSDSHDSRPMHQSPQHTDGHSSALMNRQRHTVYDVQQMASLNDDHEYVEENNCDGIRQSWPQTGRTGSSHRLHDEHGHSGEVETREQPEYAVVRGEADGLSKERERITVRLRLNSHRSDGGSFTADAVQTSPVNDGDAANHYQDTSRVSDSLHSVDSGDENDDMSGSENDGTPRYDISDEQLSDGSNSDCNQSPRHYSPRSSSTSASPSLQYDIENDNEDEAFSRSFSQFDTHDDDANGRHQSSDEDRQTFSPQQNLRSLSHTRLEQNSHAVSPVLSSGSSSVCESSRARGACSRSSSRHSWTRSESGDSNTSVDSDEDSDDSWSPADRRGVKRRCSAGSATGDDDIPDGDRRRHKLHRFR